ncbi:SHOCT domain-containing protein [Halobellus sp. EA9]|uniref:SHOCT domain-containing protein n=1 Tax=Halobellus sp. EA9 TaxID=3421647 RepID=UPI003EBFE0BF
MSERRDASRSERWWSDRDPADSDDPVVGATALLVLGAGLGSLFGVPVLAAVDFWIIFVIGYAVVVPLVSLIRGHRARDAADDRSGSAERRRRVDERSDRADESEGVDDALDRLRDRYARGDLSEAQFERKLEVLLETDTPENARERVTRGRDRSETASGAGTDSEPGSAELDREREPESERRS